MELEEAKALLAAKEKELTDLFIKEYQELCLKHGMGFQVKGQFQGNQIETGLIVVKQ